MEFVLKQLMYEISLLEREPQWVPAKWVKVNILASNTVTCYTNTSTIAANDPSVTIKKKAPTKGFSWLKAPTSTFKFKTLLTIKTVC